MSDTKRISKRRPASIRLKRADTDVPVRAERLPGGVATRPVRMERVMEARENLRSLDVDADFSRAVRIMIERELD